MSILLRLGDRLFQAVGIMLSQTDFGLLLFTLKFVRSFLRLYTGCSSSRGRQSLTAWGHLFSITLCARFIVCKYLESLNLSILYFLKRGSLWTLFEAPWIFIKAFFWSFKIFSSLSMVLDQLLNHNPWRVWILNCI